MSSAPTVISTQSQTKASRAANKEFTRLNAKRSTPQLYIQPKFAIAAPDDPLEKEADAMADKVMRMPNPEPIQFSSSKNIINRKCAECEKEEELQRKESSSDSILSVPSIVNDVLASNGRALDSDTRSYMEPRFNYDFSNVKIHDGDIAAKSASSINALAYTSGNNIVFNSGQYNTNSDSGKRLLAHELTHVVQQNGNTSSNRIQKQDAIEVDTVQVPYEESLELHNQGIDLPESGVPPPVRGQTRSRGTQEWHAQTSGRKPPRTTTKRAPGFTGDTSGTYISHIEVQIHPNAISEARLFWANMGNSRGFKLPGTLHVSPGAGNCDVDCSDLAQSQASGSHCTPLSPPDYVVQGFADHLSSDSRATFVTWYHIDRGVAFHYYNVPSYAASHGCTRLDHAESGAEWIYDNSLAGITTVRINRDPSEGPGNMCWRRGVLVPR